MELLLSSLIPAGASALVMALLVLAMTFALVREWASPEQLVFGVLVVCLLLGFLTPEVAFEGFSSPAVITIGLLYVMAAALEASRLLNGLGDRLLGKPNGAPGGPWRLSVRLLRFLGPISLISAFTNNTTLVATLIPVMRKWARLHRQPISKYLLPLSYATIVGGFCTLIGTSTNLIVQGLMLEEGLAGFSFFSLSLVGVPVAVVALLYIIFVGHRLLPARQTSDQLLSEESREFVVEVKVTPEFPELNKTVEQAGLRHLEGLFLFQIERLGQLRTPVRPNETIQPGDRLFFTGLPETILELQKRPGLVTVQDAHFDVQDYDSDRHRIYEAVLSASSPLIGKSVRDSGFRSRYDAVILAIHRNGERIRKKVGDIELEAGDTLLLLADRYFLKNWYHSTEFYLVSPLENQEASKPRERSWLTVSFFLLFVGLSISGWVPVVVAAALAGSMLILFNCISAADAKRAVDWGVLVTIGGAFGIGKAITNSGLADVVGSGILEVMGGGGVLALLLVLYFLTNLYSAFISNAAAAALMFPIALQVAGSAELATLPVMILLAIAASAEFSLPIGYQTNLMVLGPGGYRVRDYLRTGLPLNILVGVCTTLLVYFFYFA